VTYDMALSDVVPLAACFRRVEGKVDALAVRVDEKFDRLVELREADLQQRAAEQSRHLANLAKFAL